MTDGCHSTFMLSMVVSLWRIHQMYSFLKSAKLMSPVKKEGINIFPFSKFYKIPSKFIKTKPLSALCIFVSWTDRIRSLRFSMIMHYLLVVLRIDYVSAQVLLPSFFYTTSHTVFFLIVFSSYVNFGMHINVNGGYFTDAFSNCICLSWGRVEWGFTSGTGMCLTVSYRVVN